MVSSVPAVTYLRRSAGNFGFSIEAQRTYIGAYARRNGFRVLRDYTDEGRSGLTLKGRDALKRLMSEVVSGATDFEAILVYDVSRWGRFQDFDEGAYYEFLCARFGIRLHYCAEPFINDGSLQSGVVKFVKRIMAAEYSRHLSRLVVTAQIRMASRGFRIGGYAGYGLRRAAVNDQGKVIATFEHSEHKERFYRAILIPGPKAEIDAVQRIYRLYVEDGRNMSEIAEQLNSEGVPREYRGRPWTWAVVKQILTNEKYIGTLIFNRKTRQLGRSTHRRNPRDNWVVIEDRFVGIVDKTLFERAQHRLSQITRHITDDEALDKLRWLLDQNIVPTQTVIDQRKDMPSATLYKNRFGGLAEAYRRIGFTPIFGPAKPGRAAKRRIEYDDLVVMGRD